MAFIPFLIVLAYLFPTQRRKGKQVISPTPSTSSSESEFRLSQEIESQSQFHEGGGLFDFDEGAYRRASRGIRINEPQEPSVHETRSKKKADPKGKGKQVEKPSQSRKKKDAPNVPIDVPTPAPREDFDRNLFVDSYAAQRYEVYAREHVDVGDYMIMEDFNEVDFRQYIEFQGWGNLIQYRFDCINEAIPYFYSNLRGSDFDIPILESRVSGHSFTFTPNDLGNILGIPNQGLDIESFNLESFEDHYPVGHNSFTAI